MRHILRMGGFSLVELTIVLLVVSLLAGGMLLSISGQQERITNNEAKEFLESAREAITGFTLSQGRLPCPGNPTKNSQVDTDAGKEALICSPGSCTAPDKQCEFEFGVLPWVSLGLKETDPWGNRISYFVGKEFANPLTKNEIDLGVRSRVTLSTVGRAKVVDEAGREVASELPAVLVSHGANQLGAWRSDGSKIAGASLDEEENSNATLTFVAHPPSSAPNSFDDHVVWIVPTILKSRLVVIGKLP